MGNDPKEDRSNSSFLGSRCRKRSSRRSGSEARGSGEALGPRCSHGGPARWGTWRGALAGRAQRGAQAQRPAEGSAGSTPSGLSELGGIHVGGAPELGARRSRWAGSVRRPGSVGARGLYRHGVIDASARQAGRAPRRQSTPRRLVRLQMRGEGSARARRGGPAARRWAPPSPRGATPGTSGPRSWSSSPGEPALTGTPVTSPEPPSHW